MATMHLEGGTAWIGEECIGTVVSYYSDPPKATDPLDDVPLFPVAEPKYSQNRHERRKRAAGMRRAKKIIRQIEARMTN